METPIDVCGVGAGVLGEAGSDCSPDGPDPTRPPTDPTDPADQRVPPIRPIHGPAGPADPAGPIVPVVEGFDLFAGSPAAGLPGEVADRVGAAGLADLARTGQNLPSLLAAGLLLLVAGLVLRRTGTVR